MPAHITSYLHAAAAAADDCGTPSAAPAAPLFLCDGRATSAPQASRRVAALATGMAQRLGMQVGAGVASTAGTAAPPSCRASLPADAATLALPLLTPQPGDRVCVAALATDHCMEALLAVTSAGGVAAPLNWRWGAGEAAGSARLVGARLLAADAACLRFALGLACAAAADALQQEDPSSEQPAARQPGGGGCVATLLLLGPPASFPAADLASAPPRLALVFAESLIADGACGASLELHSAPGGAALIVYTSGVLAGGQSVAAAGCSGAAAQGAAAAAGCSGAAAQGAAAAAGGSSRLARATLQACSSGAALRSCARSSCVSARLHTAARPPLAAAPAQAPPGGPRVWPSATRPCTPSPWPSCLW